jgi:hypothetical protein
MTWQNADGLFVKFGREEARVAVGGEYRPAQSQYVIDFEIDYTEVESATAAIVNGTAGVGPFGIEIPEGAVVRSTEVTTLTAPTSSGTVASASLVIGTVKASDRSTALDVDGLSTTSFVIGTVLESVGESVVVKPGVTGAGDDYGVAFAENGVIVAANSAHATNPYTAGKWKVRITYEYV